MKQCLPTDFAENLLGRTKIQIKPWHRVLGTRISSYVVVYVHFYSVYIWLLLLNFHSRFFLFIIQSNTVKFFSLLSESLSSSPLLSFLVCQTITFLWLHDAGDVTFSLLLSWGRPSSSYRYPFALCFKQLLAGVLVFCLYLFTFFFFLLCLTWIMNHFNNDFEDTCC